MILQDAREPDKILKAVQKKKADIKKDFLEVGDYLLDNGYAIERKDNDLLSSIMSHRIFEQLNNLCNYEHPILAFNVENIWKMFYYSHSRFVHKQYLGVITTLIIKYPNLKLMPYLGEDQFVELLVSLDKKIGDDSKSERPSPMQRKGKNINIKKENALCAIDGVSVAKAKKLLECFGSVKNIANSSEDELLMVDKIGKKLAENIIKTLN